MIPSGGDNYHPSHTSHSSIIHYTIRILSGRRPLVGGNSSSANGINHGMERCIRFEVTDECAEFRRPSLPPSQPLTTHNEQTGCGTLASVPNTPGPPVMMQQQQHQLPVVAMQSQNHYHTFGCAGVSTRHGPIHTFELEVGETDFANLRRDQALLVDFGSFADSFIALLGYCDLGETTDELMVDPEGLRRRQQPPDGSAGDTGLPTPPRTPYSSEVPQYTCRLEDFSSDNGTLKHHGTSQHQARFSIVESNQFRELTHLSLNLNKGTDASIRSYLSSRLHQTMTDNATLRCNLQRQIGRADDAERSVRDITSSMNQLKTKSEAEKRDMQIKTEEAMQTESSRHAEETRRALEKKEEEIQLLESKRRQEISELQHKLDVLEGQRSQLSKDKSAVDADNTRLRDTLRQREDKVISLGAELETAGRKLTQAGTDNAAFEKSFHEAKIQIAALEQTKISQEQALDQSDTRRKAAEAGAANAGDTLKSHLTQLQESRARVLELESELSDSKETLARYQRDRTEMKLQVKDSSDAIQKKDQELTETKTQVESIKQTMDEMESSLQQAKVDKRATESELAEAKAKLAQSAKLLESNQQIITWLNKEINDAQLGRTSGASSFIMPEHGIHSPTRRYSSGCGGNMAASSFPSSLSGAFPRSHFSSSIAGLATPPHRPQQSNPPPAPTARDRSTNAQGRPHTSTTRAGSYAANQFLPPTPCPPPSLTSAVSTPSSALGSSGIGNINRPMSQQEMDRCSKAPAGKFNSNSG